jgi:endonuclease YncB( thermonuclease family)
VTKYLSAFTYNASVMRVIDADTLEVDVDHGFYLHNAPIPVRLLGCNSAEKGTPGGDAARDHLVALLPVGTPIVLSTAKPDKFAPRWDADVTYRGPDGRYRDLVADLIADQWTAPWNGKGTKPVPIWPRTVSP